MLMNIQFPGETGVELSVVSSETSTCVLTSCPRHQCKNNSDFSAESTQIDWDSSFSTSRFASRPGTHYNSGVHPLAFCQLFGELKCRCIVFH